MLSLKTPNGLDVEVPENISEDNSPRFDVKSNSQEAVKYYEENGYVIFSNCISEEICKKLRNIWEEKIKPFQLSKPFKFFKLFTQYGYLI